MFSYWISTLSGADSVQGAKHHIALTPHATSRSQAACALFSGTVMMPMRVSCSWQYARILSSG